MCLSQKSAGLPNPFELRQDAAAEDDVDDSLCIHGVVLEEDQVVNAVGVDIAHIAARRAKRRDVDDDAGAQRNVVLASDRHGAVPRA